MSVSFRGSSLTKTIRNVKQKDLPHLNLKKKVSEKKSAICWADVLLGTGSWGELHPGSGSDGTRTGTTTEGVKTSFKFLYEIKALKENWSTDVLRGKHLQGKNYRNTYVFVFSNE